MQFRIRNNCLQIWRPVEYFSSANTPEGFLAKKRLEIFPYIRGDELITKPQSVQYSWLLTSFIAGTVFVYSSAHLILINLGYGIIVGKFEDLLNNTPEVFWLKKRLEIFPYIRGEELITKPQSVQCSWLLTSFVYSSVQLISLNILKGHSDSQSGGLELHKSVQSVIEVKDSARK